MTHLTDRQQLNRYAIGITSVILVLFLVSVTVMPLLYTLFGVSKPTVTILFMGRTIYWVVLAALFLYARQAEKQNLLLWKDKQYPAAEFILSIVAVIGTIIIGLMVINILYRFTGLSRISTQLLALVEFMRKCKLLLVFTALTAGVVEELVFRGYIQPRLELLLKSPWLSIIISSIVFGLLHYRYGTVINVIGPMFISFVFAIYYWKYRNIKVLILCHFLWDLLSLFMLLKRH